MLCLRGDDAQYRHQKRHDHHDTLPHRAHQHEHLSVCALSRSYCVSASSYIAHAPHGSSPSCFRHSSHPHALMMCAVLPRLISPLSSLFTSRTSLLSHGVGKVLGRFVSMKVIMEMDQVLIEQGNLLYK